VSRTEYCLEVVYWTAAYVHWLKVATGIACWFAVTAVLKSTFPHDDSRRMPEERL